MCTSYILSAELSIRGSEGALAQQYVVAPIMFMRVARMMEWNQNFQRSIFCARRTYVTHVQQDPDQNLFQPHYPDDLFRAYPYDTSTSVD